MCLELANGEVVELTVRRAETAERVISRAIALARADRSLAAD
jgi:hypothetical protein